MGTVYDKEFESGPFKSMTWNQNWIRQAGSSVYTDDRDVTGGLRPDRGWDLRNRGFVVKFNKLLRF